jgi:hypothetical protein
MKQGKVVLMLHPDYLMGVKAGTFPPTSGLNTVGPPGSLPAQPASLFFSSTNHSHLRSPTPVLPNTPIYYCGYCSCSHLHRTLALQTPHTSPS